MVIRFPHLAALGAVASLLAAAPAVVADRTSPKLDGLFERLQTADDAAEAKTIEHAIWHIWIERGDSVVDYHMERGMLAMNSGAYGESLEWFDKVVAARPDYAEGWNKRATVHYLLGDYARSVSDIERTLALEPRHLGALSGLGLIFDALGNREAAMRAWQNALAIHPFLAGARQRVEEIRRELRGKAI